MSTSPSPPDTALAWIFMHDWIFFEAHGHNIAWLDAPYGGHGWDASLSRIDVLRAKSVTHEILHACLPNPLKLTDAGWSLYAPPVTQWDDHSIPGMTSYGDKADPVTGTTVQGSSSLTLGVAEARVSPFAVRTIKTFLKVPNKIFR